MNIIPRQDFSPELIRRMRTMPCPLCDNNGGGVVTDVRPGKHGKHLTIRCDECAKDFYLDEECDETIDSLDTVETVEIEEDVTILDEDCEENLAAAPETEADLVSDVTDDATTSDILTEEELEDVEEEDEGFDPDDMSEWEEDL